MKDVSKYRRNARKICCHCHERRALYCRRSIVRWKRGFDLCFECHRALVNSLRSPSKPLITIPLPVSVPVMPLPLAA